MNPRLLSDLVFGCPWRPALVVPQVAAPVVAQSVAAPTEEPESQQVSVDEITAHILEQVEQRLTLRDEQHQSELRGILDTVAKQQQSLGNLGKLLKEWTSSAEKLKAAPEQITGVLRRLEFLTIYCHYLYVGGEALALNINPLLEDAAPVPESVATMVEQNRTQYEARLFEMAQRLQIPIPAISEPLEASTPHS